MGVNSVRLASFYLPGIYRGRMRLVALRQPLIFGRGRSLWRLVGLLLLVMALPQLACAFLPGNGDADPADVTPAPADTLVFNAPLYTATLGIGDAVPGTQLRYLARNGSEYQVTIDGLGATKRVGDSFTWRGTIAPGVLGRYNLRITPTFITDDLIVAGPVEIVVLNPIPIELAGVSAGEASDIHYSGIPIDHTLPVGGQLPGSTLVFQGLTEDGAFLAGTEGYPYRAIGDSLIWTGRLRTGVTARYALRVTTLDEERLRLTGTAELWVTPAG